MPTALTALTPPATPTTTQADASRSRLAGNFDTFLSLLTTQLQNQDPLSPVDTDQFTQQLVQFTGVEQQIQTNSLLQSLVGQANSTSAGSALNFLGQAANFRSDTAVLAEGGQIDFQLRVPTNAVEAELIVTDANGREVQRTRADRAGFGTLQTFSWDGESASGASAPPGRYTLSTRAIDAEGSALPVAISVRETITGVDLSQGEPLYLTNSGPRPYSSILGVSAP